MNILIDKLILLVGCGGFFLAVNRQEFMIVIFLAAIIVSGTNSYFDKEKLVYITTGIYGLACFANPEFLYLAPLVCYDLYRFQKWAALAFLLPFLYHREQSLWYYFVIMVLLFLFAFILQMKTSAFVKMKALYYRVQDDSRETTRQFSSKNKELLEKQDYEINLATLRERNRIARDIHDNVGHLLSRALLQTGALSAITTEERTKKDLYGLQETLTNAMNSVRSSVHDLHDESIDLHGEIQALTEKFTFCPVSLSDDITSIDNSGIKYCFIAVVKEALSNVAKHSNATQVRVFLREHPGLYQLIIEDNGISEYHAADTGGIGLIGIKDRAEALNGHVHFSSDHGFRIFLAIPKT